MPYGLYSIAIGELELHIDGLVQLFQIRMVNCDRAVVQVPSVVLDI